MVSAWAVALIASMAPGPAEAVEREPDPPATDAEEPEPEGTQPTAEAEAAHAGTRYLVVRPSRPAPQRDRAASVVSLQDLSERLPRSVPDALRGEPGVYVQQTAHGQASPYLRGLTGQQTVMFFDGVRLNNSTFRQGPNQYFFTINSRTIDHLEIQRGSASTRWGSDAIGGAILATPIEARLEPGKRVVVHSRGIVRTTTAPTEPQITARRCRAGGSLRAASTAFSQAFTGNPLLKSQFGELAAAAAQLTRP